MQYEKNDTWLSALCEMQIYDKEECLLRFAAWSITWTLGIFPYHNSQTWENLGGTYFAFCFSLLIDFFVKFFIKRVIKYSSIKSIIMNIIFFLFLITLFFMSSAQIGLRGMENYEYKYSDNAYRIMFYITIVILIKLLLDVLTSIFAISVVSTCESSEVKPNTPDLPTPEELYKAVKSGALGELCKEEKDEVTGSN